MWIRCILETALLNVDPQKARQSVMGTADETHLRLIIESGTFVCMSIRLDVGINTRYLVIAIRYRESRHIHSFEFKLVDWPGSFSVRQTAITRPHI
jgi:hypothetical protein